MNPETETKIIRFHFVPIEEENEAGADVFIAMQVPVQEDAKKDFEASLSDCVSSYIDSAPSWSFEQLALEVAQSFDPNAAIENLITIDI